MPNIGALVIKYPNSTSLITEIPRLIAPLTIGFSEGTAGESTTVSIPSNNKSLCGPKQKITPASMSFFFLSPIRSAKSERTTLNPLFAKTCAAPSPLIPAPKTKTFFIYKAPNFRKYLHFF